jgi:hypothetical protein
MLVTQPANTHSEYVILPLHGDSENMNAPHCHVTHTLPVLLCHCFHLFGVKLLQLLVLYRLLNSYSVEVLLLLSTESVR